MDEYPLLTNLGALLLLVVGLVVWLRHMAWQQRTEPVGGPVARAWQALAKAQGWKTLSSGPDSPFVRVQGTLAEQAFELHIPTADPPDRPTQVSVAVPEDWTTDKTGTVSSGAGRFRHRVPDAEVSLGLVHRSFALFNMVIRQRMPHWEPSPGWTDAAGQGVWPRMQRDIGVLHLEAALQYTNAGLQTCIVAQCALSERSFRITHASQAKGPKVSLGTPALDQLLHARGDLSTIQPLLSDPSAVEVILALLHTYPGARLEEHGVVLLTLGDLGEDLAPALQAVSALAEHLDRLPCTQPPRWS